MTILIIFESLEGQTRKISEFVEERCQRAGYRVRMVSTHDMAAQISVEGAEKVVLAAPVHERLHPKGFEFFVASHKDELNALKTLMISVSLNAAFPEGRAEALDFLTEMQRRTGFEPDSKILAAGAVRPDCYGYFESVTVRNSVLADRKINVFEGIREFTNWDALATEVDAFVNM
ncbi:protoporphyrinogen oxidase [Loktanella sp. 5RATIMAR09]|uniref:flavodoxin domain-containing protein n=1 Tax=Loktanella sp. 5RATIMAR09 TaxID=1225655 RepID=UPI0006EB3FE0|nr:flavodoxin domain-containing protein [Loktanella sp. 5RATIMAR09]KQI73711.1 protoporphyrinogen oxidase [Loktanella sp. 5RATIMAR09]